MTCALLVLTKEITHERIAGNYVLSIDLQVDEWFHSADLHLTSCCLTAGSVYSHRVSGSA